MSAVSRELFAVSMPGVAGWPGGRVFKPPSVLRRDYPRLTAAPARGDNAFRKQQQGEVTPRADNSEITLSDDDDDDDDDDKQQQRGR